MQRDVHQNYLLSGLEGLPSYMRSLDASRPWLVFWILHSLSLLNRLHHVPQLTLMNCIDFLKRCQHPRGGFGGGPGQLPHLAPTYAATMALATIGGRVALDVINRPAMIEFLMRLKDPITGAFHVHENGEADVRGTYTALAVASMLNLLTPELTKDTASFLLR
jgi:protein farnesyltransferase subunit beta